MNVDWAAVKDVAELLGLVAAGGMFVLVAHLKKHFPSRGEIANAYVTKQKFTREMRRLREDLATQLGNSANNTDRLLREGIQALRGEVNAMGGRIQTAHEKALAAEAKGENTADLLRRTEQDFGQMKNQIQGIADKLGDVGESVAQIGGLLEQQRRTGNP